PGLAGNAPALRHIKSSAADFQRKCQNSYSIAKDSFLIL
ncbi:unnamed protein product, partial [Larinioides sclopetarius]